MRNLMNKELINKHCWDLCYDIKTMADLKARVETFPNPRDFMDLMLFELEELQKNNEMLAIELEKAGNEMAELQEENAKLKELVSSCISSIYRS